MSLLKLWNSLCGRTSTEKTETENPAQACPPSTPAEPVPTRGSVANRSVTKPIVAETIQSKSPAQSKGLFGFGRSNAESGLCKLLKPLHIRSLLEIGVGDGSRAVTVVSAIGQNQPESKLRYCAIDSFEMENSLAPREDVVPLVQFHRRLRTAGISPHIFPGSLDQELLRLSHTVGRVDVVLIAESVGNWQNPTTLRNLQRVCHETSVVYYSDSGIWKLYQMPTSEIRKAA